MGYCFCVSVSVYVYICAEFVYRERERVGCGGCTLCIKDSIQPGRERERDYVTERVDML